MKFSRVLTHSLSLQKWRNGDILSSWSTSSVSMWILNKVMWAAAWPLNSQHYQDSQKQDAILQNLTSDQGTKMSRTLLTTNWPICTSQGTMMPGPRVLELCARPRTFWTPGPPGRSWVIPDFRMGQAPHTYQSKQEGLLLLSTPKNCFRGAL